MVTKTGLVKVICHQKMPSNNKVSKLMQIIWLLFLTLQSRKKNFAILSKPSDCMKK